MWIAAAGIGAGGDARLEQHQVQRVAAAGADDRQILDDVLAEDVAVVAGGAGLHQFGGGEDLDALGEGADLQLDVDGGRLADG